MLTRGGLWWPRWRRSCIALCCVVLLGQLVPHSAPLKIVVWQDAAGSGGAAARSGGQGQGRKSTRGEPQEEQEELESFDIPVGNLRETDGAQLKKRIRSFLSTDPREVFDIILPGGRPLDDSRSLANQGVSKHTTLKFVPRSTSSERDNQTPSSSQHEKARLAAAMRRLQPDTIVEGSDGRLWSLVLTHNRRASQTVLSKQRVPSSNVFDAMFPNKVWNRDIQRVDAKVLDQMTTGPMLVYRNMSVQEPPSVLKGPVPIRSDIGVECGEHPFAHGVVSGVSFWFRPWMEDAAKDKAASQNGLKESPLRKHESSQHRPRGHRSVFHTGPMLPGSLAPVLMVDDTHKLFLGYIDSRRGNEVELKGVMTRATFSGREWEHVAVVFDASASSLQLYHNGQLASTPLRVPLPDSGKMPRIAPVRRSLVFGKGKIMQGASGILDNVMIHHGRAVSEIREEFRQGGSSARSVPDWLDEISWPLASSRRMVEPPDTSAATDRKHENTDKDDGGGEGPNENLLDGPMDATASMFSLGMALLSAPPPPTASPSSPNAISAQPSQVLGSEDQTSQAVADGVVDAAYAEVPGGSDWRAQTVFRIVRQASHHRVKEVARRNKWMTTPLEAVVNAAVPYADSPNDSHNECISLNAGWWTYDVCRGKTVLQRHEKKNSKKSDNEKSVHLKLGSFDPVLTSQQAPTETSVVSEEQLVEIYSEGAHCDEINAARTTSVVYRCCQKEKPRGAKPFILRVEEPNTCEYRVIVCVNTICLRDGKGMTLQSEDVGSVVATDKSNTNTVVPGSNVALVGTARASSSWSKIFDAGKACDGDKDTYWKASSARMDPKPWIFIDLSSEGQCRHGISSMRLNWDLAPEAYTIKASPKTSVKDGEDPKDHNNEKFIELADIARQPKRHRADYLDESEIPFPANKLARYINISITSIGPWTANSLVEFVVTCKSIPDSMRESEQRDIDSNNRAVSSSSDSAEDENEGRDLLSGVFEPLKELLSHGEQDKDKMRRDHAAAIKSFALHILVSEGDHLDKSPTNGVAGGEVTPEDHQDAQSSQLMNSWSLEDAQSGSFLALAAYHYNGGKRPHENLEDLLRTGNSITGASRDVANENARNAIMVNQSKGSCMAAAALYRHEAYLAVGGAKEGSKHPVPIQELKLSTAKTDEIDRHRDRGGDEGQYQQNQADQGDVNAIKWIASRHYHGLNGFARDLPRAAQMFRQAAEAGDAEARYNYAVMRLTGQDGNPPDVAMAQRHFEEAAAQDFPPALNGLGLRHMGGASTDLLSRLKGEESHDYKKAFEYFTRSALKNSADGHYNLATLYKEGHGVEKSIPAAMMHFAIAAALGQHRAQWMLGDALHSHTGFLSEYLAEALYLDKDSSAGGDGEGDLSSDYGENFIDIEIPQLEIDRMLEKLRGFDDDFVPDEYQFDDGRWNMDMMQRDISMYEGTVDERSLDDGNENSETVRQPGEEGSEHLHRNLKKLAKVRVARIREIDDKVSSALFSKFPSWENEHNGVHIVANASLATGVSVAVSQLHHSHTMTLSFPINQISCSHAVDFFRPLAETRAAGSAYRAGIKSWIAGDNVEAERLFQASSWMGLNAGTSNAAWLLRQQKSPFQSGMPDSTASSDEANQIDSGDISVLGVNVGSMINGAARSSQRDTSTIKGAARHYALANPGDDSPEHVSSREDHAFAYAVQAAIEGDLTEHVIVASAIYEVAGSGDASRSSQIQARKDAVRAWLGAVKFGSPEAASELGVIYVIGDPLLGIDQNYTVALEHLGSCGGRGVMYEGIGGRPVPLECMPSQLLIWYIWGRQTEVIDATLSSLQKFANKHGENGIILIVAVVCMMLVAIACCL